MRKINAKPRLGLWKLLRTIRIRYNGGRLLHLPAAMIVCLCHRVSDRDIRRAVESGVRDFETLQDETAVARGCGCCHDCAREVFDQAVAATPARVPAPIWMAVARPTAA